MFYADFVIAPYQATLEQAESVLNRVGVIDALSITAAVVDSAMYGENLAVGHYLVDRSLIGLQSGSRVNMLHQFRLDYGSLVVGNRNQPKPPAAFDHAKHNVFLCSLRTRQAFAMYFR